MTLVDTKKGAINRLEDLKVQAKIDYDFLIAIEGGIIKMEDEDFYRRTTSCVIEDGFGKQSLSFNIDLEIPKEMTDKISDDLPSIGFVATKLYGNDQKDLIEIITGGKINRKEMIQRSIIDALWKFDLF